MSRTAYFPLIGRLGNLMFIYAHARAWCDQFACELCLDPWIGEKIFQIPEAIRPSPSRRIEFSFKEAYYQDQGSLIYTRKQVRAWFTLKPELLQRLQVIPSEPLLLNVRQADDYRSAGLVTLSKQCYLDAAVANGYATEMAAWEIDTNPTRLSGFEGDFSAGGLGVTSVAIPSFYRLMTAKVLFRANSTFSWWAATLSQGKVYSPIIKGLEGGKPDVYGKEFVEGNWPVMADCAQNSDLYLKET